MKSNKIFIVWGTIVLVIVVLLTVLGFMLKKVNNDYSEVEEKLVNKAKKYVDYKFLYPAEGEITKITSEELIENEFLDELKKDDDVCRGYVIIKLDGVYKYNAYINCEHYTTKGYNN